MTPDLLQLLADTTQDDGTLGQILPWITTFVVAVISAVLGKKVSDAKRVKVSPSPFPIELSEKVATKEELDALEERISEELQKIEAALLKERDVARTANGTIHARIDKSTEAIAEVKGELNQINANLSRLLDLAMKRPRGS